MRSLALLFSAVFLSGCGSMPAGKEDVKYEERNYVLDHKEGFPVMVIAHLFNPNIAEEYITRECWGDYREGWVLHGCARRKMSGSFCIIYVPYPVDGFTQSVVNHEEAHCMGWEHEDDLDDPTYIKAKGVGL